MPRFAANLSWMYTELPFLDRFAAAAGDGFQAVECLFPYEHAPELLAGLLKAHGLRQVLFNAPSGDWAAGERGLACLPGRETEFRAGVVQALDCARVLGCSRIHVMAGLAQGDPAMHWRTFAANLAWAAPLAEAMGIELLIEPINTRDMPHYFLNRQVQAHEMVLAIGAPNLKVQMDLYHCQVSEGEVATHLRRYLPTGRVAHLQIAGVPGRHEPDLGELDFTPLFELIDELGFNGWVGCEYRPHGADTSAGLGWLRRLQAQVSP